PHGVQPAAPFLRVAGRNHRRPDPHLPAAAIAAAVGTTGGDSVRCHGLVVDEPDVCAAAALLSALPAVECLPAADGDVLCRGYHLLRRAIQPRARRKMEGAHSGPEYPALSTTGAAAGISH